MQITVRVNKNIELTFDDSDYDLWRQLGHQGPAPDLIFIPELKNKKHKITVQDIKDVNAKIDEIWRKYPRFGRYDKPEFNNPQDLLGEDHALIIT